MRLLRRSRWLRAFAVLGALLAPGTGGAVLQAAHPCAVAAPWLAEETAVSGVAAEHDAAGHRVAAPTGHAPDAHAAHQSAVDLPAGEPTPDSHGPHDGTCQCIGSCLSAAAALTAAGTPHVPVSAGTTPSSAGFAAVHARLAARLRELLPPATAPPIA